MKRPAKAKVPGPVHKGGSGKGSQPGNRPGRGKAAHTKPGAKPKPVPAKVKAARHAAAVKASKTRAANAKKAKTHPKRQLSVGSAVACCSAEALAASLRLAGRLVEPPDVLALYEHTARDEHAGASIWATLEAAGEHGLAGVRPVRFGPVDLDDPAAVILGLSLPAPHAVAVTDGAWISWGEPWPAWAFPDAVTEEAWTVTWEAL